MDGIQYLILLAVVLAAAGIIAGILHTLSVKLNALQENDDAKALSEQLTRGQTDTRRELNETVQNSVKNLGEMVSQNQKDFSAAQNEKLSALSQNLTQKQQDTKEEVARQLAAFEKRFQTFELTNEQKLDGIRSTVSKRLSEIQEENAKKLEEIRGTVDEKLQKTLEDRMTQAFKRVSDQLESVYKGLGEMRELAVGVGDLKKVLSNVKTRGILGEIQLGAILSEVLSPEQYEENCAVRPGSANRVEFAIKLPGDGEQCVYLPIDSKFPGDTYAHLQDAYETANKDLIQAELTSLKQKIRLEAKDISTKYIEPPYTTAYAILFLPFEGLYAEVVNRGLLEELQRDFKVVIAGPSTMAALLNSLQMGFRTLALQKRSNEVWKLLGAVRTEFDKFEGILAGAQKKLTQVNDDLDKLVGVRTRAINRRLKDVERLDSASTEKLLSEEESTPEELPLL